MFIDCATLLDDFLYVQARSGMVLPEDVVDMAIEGLDDGVFTEEPVTAERGPIKALVSFHFRA